MARHDERLVVLTGRTEYWRFSFDFPGVDFIRSRKIEGETLEEMLDSSIKEMTDAGIVKNITYSIDTLGKGVQSFAVSVSGCVHLPKEAKLMEDGVTPFICPIGNMLTAVILENANYEVGSAGLGGGMGGTKTDAINVEKKECTLRGRLCKNIDEVELPE